MKKYNIGLRECVVLLVVPVAMFLLFGECGQKTNQQTEKTTENIFEEGENKMVSETRVELRKRYWDYRTLEGRESNKRAQKSKEREKFDQKQILDFLGTIGATNIHTNGYWYEFEYRGWCIGFVNQTSRICVTKYMITENEEDRKIIDDMYLMRGRENPSLYIDLCKEYNYSDFIINGEAINGVKSIIEWIE